MLADLCGSSESLTSLNVSENSLHDEGAEAIASRLQSNDRSRLAHLNLAYNGAGGNRKTVEAIADMCTARPQLRPSKVLAFSDQSPSRLAKGSFTSCRPI